VWPDAVSARAERSHTASRCAANLPSSRASRSGVDPTLDIIPSPASGCFKLSARPDSNAIVSVSNRTGTSIEFALRGPGRARERPPAVVVSLTQLLLPSGYRSMNTKLALSAIVAALMLTACAKQESAAPDQAANPPPAPAATDSSAPPAAPGSEAASQAAPAGDAAKPAEGSAAPPADTTPPPKQ